MERLPLKPLLLTTHRYHEMVYIRPHGMNRYLIHFSARIYSTKNVNCFLFNHNFIFHLRTIMFTRILNTHGGSVNLKTFKDKHFTLRSKTKFVIFQSQIILYTYKMNRISVSWSLPITVCIVAVHTPFLKFSNDYLSYIYVYKYLDSSKPHLVCTEKHINYNKVCSVNSLLNFTRFRDKNNRALKPWHGSLSTPVYIQSQMAYYTMYTCYC